MSTFAYEWTGSDVFDEIVSLSRDVVHALYLLASSLIQLCGAILRPTFVIVRPIITASARFFWRYFASQSWRSIITQCLVLVLSSALAFFEKRYRTFSRAYHSTTLAVKRWQKELRKRSRMAAAAFPHLLFVVIVIGSEYLFHAIIPQIVRSIFFIAFARVRPALYSASLLSNHREISSRYSSDNNCTEPKDKVANDEKFQTALASNRPRTAFTCTDEKNMLVREQDSLLKYWSVISVIFGFRQIMHFSIPSYFSSLLLRVDTFALYMTFWLQNSATNGTDIGYNTISALFGKRLEVKTGNTRAQVGILLSILVSVGALSDSRANQVSSILAESGVALVGFLFLVTPQIVTFFGTVFIGWLAPSYLNVVSYSEDGHRQKWLSYFAVYALTDAMFEILRGPLSWFPLLYHLKMGLILWLQLPFYQGAAVILKQLQGHTSNITNSVSESTSLHRPLAIFDIRRSLSKHIKAD